MALPGLLTRICFKCSVKNMVRTFGSFYLSPVSFLNYLFLFSPEEQKTGGRTLRSFFACQKILFLQKLTGIQ
jgi:hypothetical protein